MFTAFSNYLLTESEVFPVKYQTEAVLYWPSDSEVDTCSKTEVEVNK